MIYFEIQMWKKREGKFKLKHYYFLVKETLFFNGLVGHIYPQIFFLKLRKTLFI